MAIEKQVVVQLKVARPRDGAALADAAREADRLRTGFAGAGLAASKALADAASETRKFQSDVTKGSMAVTTLAKELAKVGRESAGIDRVAAQLKALGVGADAARNAAQRLMRGLGDGARVAEADVRRLAAVIRQTGGAAPSTLGRITGAMGSMGGGSLLSRFGPSVMGGALLQGAGQAITRGLATSADDQIDAMARRDGAWQMGLGDAVRHVPIAGQIAGGVADWMTSGPRQAAAASQTRLQENIRNQERARQMRQMRTAGALAENAVSFQGQQAIGGAMIEGHAGLWDASERSSRIMADRRFDRLGERFQGEMDAVGRGEGVGAVGSGAMGDLQREMRNRPEFGTAERERIRLGRQLAMTQLARAETNIGLTGGADGSGGVDPRLVQQGVDGEALRRDALREQQEARQQLLQLEQRDVELTRQAGENEQQRLERFRQFAQQAEQAYRRIAEHERARIQTAREQFGLMDEMGRMELQQLAQRAAADGGRGIQNLSNDEVRQLQGTGLFDEQVRTEAGRRADAGGFGNLLRASGAQERQRAAEARQGEAGRVSANVENAINLNINVNAQDVARQVNERLLPAIQQMNLANGAAISQQIEQQIAAHQRQIALQNNQGG